MRTFEEKIAHLNTKGVDVYDPQKKDRTIDRNTSAELISIDDEYHRCNAYPGFNNRSICIVQEEDNVVMKIAGFTSCAALLTFQPNGSCMIGHHAALNNPLWSNGTMETYTAVLNRVFNGAETITVVTGLDERFFDGAPGSTTDIRTRIIADLYDALRGTNSELCPLFLSPEESSAAEYFVYCVKFTLAGLRQNTDRHLMELMTIPYDITL